LFDFAAIGHVVIGTIIKHDGEWTDAWGPIGCIALVAKKLGKTVKAVTKVGDDISDEYIAQLKDIGINLDGMIVKGAKTTRIPIDLRGEERRGKILDFCELINPSDVIDLPDAVVINPVMWEVPWETLKSITGEIIAVELQGFARTHRRVNDGTNLMKRWSEAGLMKRFKIFQSTEEEHWSFTGQRDTLHSLEKIISEGAEVAVATKGRNGALLAVGDERFRVPIYEINKVDDMGAGDSFISGFFCEYLDEREPLWCASMGAAMSSCILETIGPVIDTSLKEITRRAEDIYVRIERL
jgi:sugar/nucleoside kinase (ribokinase family)